MRLALDVSLSEARTEELPSGQFTFIAGEFYEEAGRSLKKVAGHQSRDQVDVSEGFATPVIVRSSDPMCLSGFDGASDIDEGFAEAASHPARLLQRYSLADC